MVSRDARLGTMSRNEVEVYFYALCAGAPVGLQWKRDDTDHEHEGWSAEIGPLVLGVDDVGEPERLIVRWAWYVGSVEAGDAYVYDYASTREAAQAAALAAVPECMVLAVAECLGMVPRG